MPRDKEKSIDSSILTIPLDKNSVKDLRFKKSGFKKCIQCGRCTASCPAAYLFSDYKPRDLMRRFMLSKIYSNEIKELIWKCGQCYSCRIRCPRNCKAGLGVLAMQSEMIQKGEMPHEIKSFLEHVKKDLFLKGETIVPSTMDANILKEFGEGTYNKFKKNQEKREALNFAKDSSRKKPIPKNALVEIKKVLELTGFCEGELP